MTITVTLTDSNETLGTFILTHGIGQAFIEKNVDAAAVAAYIEEMRG